MMPVRLLILGSSGSIGRSALNVVRRNPSLFCISGLVVHRSTDVLLEQIAEFGVTSVGVVDQNAARAVADQLPSGVRLYTGESALTQMPAMDGVDCVVDAVVGMAGLPAVIAAITAGRKVALANKEALVAGGAYVMRLAARNNVRITPIDSEHAAIAECLGASRGSDVRRLVLTASGGPFFGHSRQHLDSVTIDQALRHPTWRMGPKITIDCATMVNKALEMIEARWLYDTTAVEYVIHRQSIIHSMVEFVDGSVVAQLSHPDMELPIQQAISDQRLWRPATSLVGCNLTFEQPDEVTFPAPRLAASLLERDSLATAAFNSANEAAVALYLSGRIKLGQIYDIIEKHTLEYTSVTQYSIDDICALHQHLTAKIDQDTH